MDRLEVFKMITLNSKVESLISSEKRVFKKINILEDQIFNLNNNDLIKSRILELEEELEEKKEILEKITKKLEINRNKLEKITKKEL